MKKGDEGDIMQAKPRNPGTNYQRKLISDEIGLLSNLPIYARSYTVYLFTLGQVTEFRRRLKRLKRKWRVSWWYSLAHNMYVVMCSGD